MHITSTLLQAEKEKTPHNLPSSVLTDTVVDLATPILA